MKKSHISHKFAAMCVEKNSTFIFDTRNTNLPSVDTSTI